ncbi:hypothetical protein N9Y22_00190 [Alphaproteobacteria bacterium]|nr:hypothetical protein [Alphaproteobacteria bacterium]
MNESLELRNRINKMRSINNLEISDEKLLNKEKNKLVNTQKIEQKIYIDESKKKVINNPELKKFPKINNALDNFQKKQIHRKDVFKGQQLNLNKNKNFNNDNEAQFRLLANKFNESVEVILELSEKVNNLEHLIYNHPKNKKSRNLLFFFNSKVISIVISVFIVGYVFLLIPMDTSAINQILNDIFSAI